MPVIKCTACGYRHMQAVPRCINCAAPLAAPTSAERQTRSQAKNDADLVAPSSPQNSEMADYERFLAEETQSESAEEQLERSSDLQQHTQPESAAPSRQLVKHDSQQMATRQLWQKKTEVQVYEPYSSTIDVMHPEPFSEAGARTVAVKEENEHAVDPELWKTDRLPWYFPRIRPNIAGTVIHIESKEEIIDYPDFFSAVATLLVEIIWIMTDTQQQRESDRVVMTTVRVQTYDGHLRDTRLRGNMRGADLSLGDKVSLWGWKRRGVLFMSRGFNHTTQGVVSTTSVGLIVPAIVVLLLLVVGVYFEPTWSHFISHWFTSSFGPFISFFHQHPIAFPMQKKK